VRLRLLSALTVAMLSLTGTALAQDTTTEPTSSYTTTTPTTTTPKAPTKSQGSAPTTAGQEQSSAVPKVAAQPAGSAPSKLAFTGGEPLVLILGGMVLTGGAMTLLVRDRRRTSQDR